MLFVYVFKGQLCFQWSESWRDSWPELALGAKTPYLGAPSRRVRLYRRTRPAPWTGELARQLAKTLEIHTKYTKSSRVG